MGGRAPLSSAGLEWEDARPAFDETQNNSEDGELGPLSDLGRGLRQYEKISPATDRSFEGAWAPDRSGQLRMNRGGTCTKKSPTRSA
jgi:hypothetical protein